MLDDPQVQSLVPWKGPVTQAGSGGVLWFLGVLGAPHQGGQGRVGTAGRTSSVCSEREKLLGRPSPFLHLCSQGDAEH